MSAQSDAASDLLSQDELRTRASAGLVVTATRAFVMLVLGFGGNVVLARMLVPREFGLVAVGTTMIMFITVVSDGGLGAGLIRRPEPPSDAELRSVMGMQLALTTALGVVIAIVGVPLGDAGVVMAVMLASLPFLAIQTPGRVVLERSLRFHPLAVVDIVGLVAYLVWAIGGVAAGFGVWALATGAIVRAAASGAAMVALSGIGLTPPLFSIRPIRPLLGFGLRFQGTNVAWNVRDQGLNAATGALAGVASLGLWSLVRRLLEVPMMLFESLWRVSFPAMAQILAAKEDPAPVIERSLARTAVTVGLVLTALAASAPGLVPGLFGEQWSEAADVVPWTCLALLVAGPISMCTVGYLFAAGNAAAVLRTSVLHVATCFAVAVPLLPVFGVTAVGMGWLAGSVAEAIALVRVTAARTRARLVRQLVVPLPLAVLGAAVGWMLADVDRTLVSGVLGGAAAAAVYLVGLALLRWSLVVDTVGFMLRATRAAVTTR
jgi:O-antigen/teichoic acid export membrane protein